MHIHVYIPKWFQIHQIKHHMKLLIWHISIGLADRSAKLTWQSWIQHDMEHDVITGAWQLCLAVVRWDFMTSLHAGSNEIVAVQIALAIFRYWKNGKTRNTPKLMWHHGDNDTCNICANRYTICEQVLLKNNFPISIDIKPKRGTSVDLSIRNRFTDYDFQNTWLYTSD